MLNGTVQINKGAVGANASAGDISTTGFVFYETDNLLNATFNIVYSARSLEEVLSILGGTINYDIDNGTFIFRHFVDFYSMSPKGTLVYFMFINREDYSLEEVLSTENIGAKLLLTTANGAIKQLGICANLYDQVLVDGLPASIRAGIAQAQLLYDWAYERDKPCQILLDGSNISENLGSLINLRAIPVGNSILDANKVSIVIGQDWDYCENEGGGDFFYRAAVGKCLGTIAAAAMNQSIAEVDENTGGFNLTNVKKGYFVNGGLSNHMTLVQADPYLDTLDNKGYIFPRTYYGVSGLRWNGDHTCCPITIDDDGNINEHTIYYGRTMDYTSLKLKVHFTKYLKKRAFADVTTGNLSTGVIKVMEKDANNTVFGKMVADSYISGGKATIDKTSDLITPPKKLKVGFKVVPTIIIDNIEGTIYLNRNL
jgi:Protein of unknown function (DUF2586)